MQSFFLKQPVAAVFIRSPSGGITRNLKQPKSDRLLDRTLTTVKLAETGVGLGADHQRYAQAGADLYGIDLTERAIEHTQRRLATFGLSSQLAVGEVKIRTVFTHGDLLESGAGQRHQGRLLSLARKIWPRAFLKRFFPTLDCRASQP